MSQDSKDPNSEKNASNAGKSGRREVELFPVIGERRRVPMVAAAPVAAGGGNRIGTQISIFEPSTFDEALEIVECLRSRAATTITLDKMRKSDASRLVDFVTGASAALDGDFHKLTDQVYVFCPSNIRITAAASVTSTQKQPGALDFLFNTGDSVDKSSLWSKGQ